MKQMESKLQISVTILNVNAPVKRQRLPTDFFKSNYMLYSIDTHLDTRSESLKKKTKHVSHVNSRQKKNWYNQNCTKQNLKRKLS